MSKRAFTFAEVMIVMLVIVILAIVAITDFVNTNTQAKLRSASFRLKSDIIYAQSLAVTQQVNCGIVFTPGAPAGSYSVYRQTTTNIVNNPLTQAPFTVDYASDPVLEGVTLYSTSFGSPTTNRLEFDSLGIPSDGTNILGSDGTVTLTYGGDTATVKVTKNTGKVD